MREREKERGYEILRRGKKGRNGRDARGGEVMLMLPNYNYES